MVPRSALPVVALIALPCLATACAAGPSGNAGPATARPAAETNASPESVANARRAYAGVFQAVERAGLACEQGAGSVRSDLAAALDEADRVASRGEPTSRMLSELRAEHVAFTIAFPSKQWTPFVRDGVTTRRQQAVAADPEGKQLADLQDLRRTEQHAGGVADELRVEVALFGKAFADAHADHVACEEATRQAAAHLLNYDRPELRDPLRAELGGARELLRRVVRAREANAGLEASATALFAALESAAAHDHPEILDHTLAASRTSLAEPPSISDPTIDAGARRAIHEEAARLVRNAADRAGEAGAALYLVTVTRDAEADLTGSAPSEGRASAQAGSAADAFIGPASLEDAMKAVTRGDYRSALKGAAPYLQGQLARVVASSGSLTSPGN
jgi:hypothetical protein